MPAHRYWRIWCGWTAQQATVLAEIEMRASVGGADQCSGGTPFATYSHASYPASNAFDNDTGTIWSSHDHGGDEGIGYDFGAGNEKDIAEVALTPGVGLLEFAPTTIRLEYSDNGSDYTIARIFFTTWPDADQQTFKNRPAVSKQVWALDVTAPENAVYTYVSVGEIQFRIAVGGADQCVGGTAYADSIYNATYAPDKAFDDDVGTCAASAAGTLTCVWEYEFAAAKEIIEYVVTARSDTENVPASSPKDWTLKYWDGTQWVVADTQTDQTGWVEGESRVFAISGGGSSGNALWFGG